MMKYLAFICYCLYDNYALNNIFKKSFMSIVQMYHIMLHILHSFKPTSFLFYRKNYIKKIQLSNMT